MSWCSWCRIDLEQLEAGITKMEAMAAYTPYSSKPRVFPCYCASWDLFHYGCKCGSFKSEQEAKAYEEPTEGTA